MSDRALRQSLENFEKAYKSLGSALARTSLSDLEMSGAIQNFEFTFELAWKTLKKRGEGLGRLIPTPREAFSYALAAGFISDDQLWVEMIRDRNRTVHAYDRAEADAILARVRADYFAALGGLLDGLKK